MPISITATADFGVLAIKAVEQAEKAAKYALRTSINQTAFAARTKLLESYHRILDRPVPFIARAYFYRKATSLENPVASLVVAVGGNDEGKDPYIDAITRTGKHVASRLTRKYRSEGLLRSHETLHPTRAVKRNSRGNVSGSFVTRLLQSKGRNQKIVIRKGKYRGLYQNIRGRFTKIYTPSTPGRYRRNPLIDVNKELIPVVKDFDRLYKENYQKNLNRSQSRRV